ncbi:MAG TPA: DUF4421 domain-containing protein [Cyclobacteriaceae bacterium]|nr:DUF4421 domain-containing protein [Cyclobacteriaceae bacterium]
MKRTAFVLWLALISERSPAQIDTAISPPDSTYYTSYSTKITARAFLSQKYTRLNYSNRKEGYSLDYRPNTNLVIGIGATYKWATLNVSHGFNFLNNDPEKGKTHYFDLQFHGYGTRIQVDGFGQFYNGFFLTPKGAASTPGKFYTRPDIKVNEIGLSVQYIVNHKRFSFRSAFLQNDWQRRSAGSILVGFETYGGRIKADSVFVPRSLVKGDLSLQELYRSYFELGPNIGYAYTLVIRQHFFLTGALSVSLDYGFNTSETAITKTWSNGLSSNTFVRFVAGYNSRVDGLSFIYLNNGVNLTTQTDSHITLNTGNFRFTYTHRFTPSNKEKKFLKKIIK